MELISFFADCFDALISIFEIFSVFFNLNHQLPFRHPFKNLSYADNTIIYALKKSVNVYNNTAHLRIHNCNKTHFYWQITINLLIFTIQL